MWCHRIFRSFRWLWCSPKLSKHCLILYCVSISKRLIPRYGWHCSQLHSAMTSQTWEKLFSQADVGEGALSPSCSASLTVLQKSEGGCFIEHALASWAPLFCEFTGMAGMSCSHTLPENDLYPRVHAHSLDTCMNPSLQQSIPFLAQCLYFHLCHQPMVPFEPHVLTSEAPFAWGAAAVRTHCDERRWCCLKTRNFLSFQAPSKGK